MKLWRASFICFTATAQYWKLEISSGERGVSSTHRLRRGSMRRGAVCHAMYSTRLLRYCVYLRMAEARVLQWLLQRGG